MVVKTFVLLFHGRLRPNEHVVAAWRTWLDRRAASIVDAGTRFGPGREITNDGTTEFSSATNPASGYSIVRAPHIDAAEQLLEGCPIADSVTLYEALPVPPSHRNNQTNIETNKERTFR